MDGSTVVRTTIKQKELKETKTLRCLRVLLLNKGLNRNKPEGMGKEHILRLRLDERPHAAPAEKSASKRGPPQRVLRLSFGSSVPGPREDRKDGRMLTVDHYELI